MKRSDFLVILLLVLISALAYLPLVGELGYYHDDWFPTMARVSGVSLETMHAVDRPMMGLLYQITASLLGEQPLVWHLYAWAARTLGGLALLWLLRQVFPGWNMAAVWMVVLYLVYPGFLQQPSANNYQNHIFAYSIAILSLALSIFALNVRRIALRGLIYLAAGGMVYFYPRVYEALIGLEALRLVLLTYVLWRRSGGSLWVVAPRAVVWFLPYALITAQFLYWRLFRFESLRAGVDAKELIEGLRADPGGQAVQILLGLFQDVWETVIGAWVIPLYQLGLNAPVRALLLAGVVAVLAVTLLVFFHCRLGGQGDDSPVEDTRSHDAIWLGAVGVGLTLLPAALSGREVQFRLFLDRYTYAAIVPTALLLGGLLYAAVRPRWRTAAFCALTGLAAVTHLLNAAAYADVWQVQRSFYWQMTWRAPQIAPGTLVFAHMPQGYRFTEGQVIWAALNRIYHPNPPGPVITAQVLNRDTVGNALAGLPEERENRNIKHVLNYDHILIVSQPSANSCLQVIEPENGVFSPFEDQLVREIAAVSDLGRILTGAAAVEPPPVIFGSQPQPDWCYHYQRAGLARQQGDWREVLRLGTQALDAGRHAADPVEWLPFLEASLILGETEMAQRYAAELQPFPSTYAEICQYLQRNYPQRAGWVCAGQS